MTRCMPLIQHCLELGYDVTVAAPAHLLALLPNEFPTVSLVEMPGYAVRYSRHASTLPWRMAMQLPRLFRLIRAEQAWIRHFVETHETDLIVSDNRYGCFHPEIPSLFITHQCHIRLPFSRLLESWANRIQHAYIRRFTACLIPDDESFRLGGQLSDSAGLPATKYLGLLSQ